MSKHKHEFPPERHVVLRDPRGSRWDGAVTRVCAGPRLERSVSPGEIAVFTPTGTSTALEIVETGLRGGDKTKTVDALEYRRTSTRLVSARPRRTV